MARIHGGSPWTRTAILQLTPDELDQIEAVLPPGMTVMLGAERRPGTWIVHLMLKGTPVHRMDGVHHIPTGVVTAVNRWRAAERKVAV